MARGKQPAVLLLAHGAPDSAQDVPCFLNAVTGGRALPPAVVEEVQRRYARIGRSPLRDFTNQQAEALRRELGLPVWVAMRNWTPYIRDVAPLMAADGIDHVLVICMAPHNSRTSVGRYRQAVDEAFSRLSPPPTVDFVESWHDHPLLIQAFAQKLENGWKRACIESEARVPVIFTAHSVPVQTVAPNNPNGDPYAEQARGTAALVAREGGLSAENEDWRFAFQSQGMSGGPWLGPTVEETMDELARQGHTGVFLQPIGFLCDHVEVLYDVDVVFQEFAAERGLRLWRADSLNDSPLLTAALADIVRRRLLLAIDK